MQLIKGFLLGVLPLVLIGCQGEKEVAVNPQDSPKWELVKSVQAHHKKFTDHFELNGNRTMVYYHAESTKNWTHSNMKVFVGTGSEDVWKNPVVNILNQEEKEGRVFFQRPKGSYLLFIKSLEVHYTLKVYQKKGEASPGTESSSDENANDEAH